MPAVLPAGLVHAVAPTYFQRSSYRDRRRRGHGRPVRRRGQLQLPHQEVHGKARRYRTALRPTGLYPPNVGSRLVGKRDADGYLDRLPFGQHCHHPQCAERLPGLWVQHVALGRRPTDGRRGTVRGYLPRLRSDRGFRSRKTKTERLEAERGDPHRPPARDRYAGRAEGGQGRRGNIRRRSNHRVRISLLSDGRRQERRDAGEVGRRRVLPLLGGRWQVEAARAAALRTGAEGLSRPGPGAFGRWQRSGDGGTAARIPHRDGDHLQNEGHHMDTDWKVTRQYQGGAIRRHGISVRRRHDFGR
mmetsp:Transcript_30577/g.71645  ORF Transcript_30577/g.71645 Transcript_30577/m.71645 type:complete len:302 (+) Transcript_30577:509-1414(+)